jgi:hypothetical protein
MAALPGSGVRPDQALAIAQAFDRLMDEGESEKPVKTGSAAASRADTQETPRMGTTRER